MDKTGLIAWTNEQLNTEQGFICVSRPRRFGKSMALNMFWEYSMTDQKALEAYTGFTDTEIRALCEQFGMDFTYMGNWYDGYMFTQYRHVYNPRSVVEAVLCHRFSSYWTSTETYDALKIYMELDFDGLRADIVQMLGGGRVRVNTLSFQNDMRNFRTKDDVLPLLIHLGYLAYDLYREEAFIPNKEIVWEFENAMSVGGWTEIMRVLKASEQLLEDTLSCNVERVAAGLDHAHTEAASILTYNDENSMACAINIAYYSAGKDYRIIREFPSGHGFADILFLPLPASRKPALVVELKYDKSANAAIQQIRACLKNAFRQMCVTVCGRLNHLSDDWPNEGRIAGYVTRIWRKYYAKWGVQLAGMIFQTRPKDRKYTQALEGYSGEILLVGINYDKNSTDKPHSCVIEKVIGEL